MSYKNARSIKPSGAGFFEGISEQVKLVLRLMSDRRINLFLKALPLFSFIYLIFPDIAIGPFDDALIIWLGSYLFVELCPEEIVEEHLNHIRKVIPGTWQNAPSAEVVDGHFEPEREERSPN